MHDALYHSAPDVFVFNTLLWKHLQLYADIPLPRNRVFLSSGGWLHAMFAATIASRTCSHTQNMQQNTGYTTEEPSKLVLS